MRLTEEHLDFEEFCQELVGLTVLKVEYSEIDSEQSCSEPYYPTKFSNLDSVDFSIFFHTDNNKLVEIYWDDRFYQFGIGIKINEPSDLSNYLKWDVSGNDLWRHLIGKTISNVKLTWETVTINSNGIGFTNNFIYPQYIKITFFDGKDIFISAAGFLNQGDDAVYMRIDNLMVTDNEELARLVGMIE